MSATTGHLSSSLRVAMRGRQLNTSTSSPSRPSLAWPLRCEAIRRQRAAERAPSSGSGSRQLPREQGWLLDEANSRHGVKAVGRGFVMTRPGRQGLVVLPGAKMQPYRRRGGNSNLSLALAQLQRQTDTELVPFHLHGAPISADAIVVDAFAVELQQCVALVPSSARAAAAASAAAAGAGFLGIVAVDDGEGGGAAAAAGVEGAVVERWSGNGNPRRTSKVKFVCDRCGTTTIAPVNPAAFATGSVFGACGGCGVVHKLVDNLKLFHEVRGHIFHPQRPPVRIPRGLPQNPGIGLRKIGGYDFLKAE